MIAQRHLNGKCFAISTGDLHVRDLIPSCFLLFLPNVECLSAKNPNNEVPQFLFISLAMFDIAHEILPFLRS